MTLADRLTSRLTIPVTVDLEDGFSNDPAEAVELAAELAALGVAGINLEDGRPDGSLRPTADHAAVVKAIIAIAPMLFVNVRTDTYWASVGHPQERLAETIQRLTAYRDAGASGVFVPDWLTSPLLHAITTEVAVPLNVLWQPGVALSDYAAAGVARISIGSTLYRTALAAALASVQAFWNDATPATTPVEYGNLQQLL